MEVFPREIQMSSFISGAVAAAAAAAASAVAAVASAVAATFAIAVMITAAAVSAAAATATTVTITAAAVSAAAVAAAAAASHRECKQRMGPTQLSNRWGQRNQNYTAKRLECLSDRNKWNAHKTSGLQAHHRLLRL